MCRKEPHPFDKGVPVAANPVADDVAAQERLWMLSEAKWDLPALPRPK